MSLISTGELMVWYHLAGFLMEKELDTVWHCFPDFFRGGGAKWYKNRTFVIWITKIDNKCDNNDNIGDNNVILDHNNG